MLAYLTPLAVRGRLLMQRMLRQIIAALLAALPFSVVPVLAVQSQPPRQQLIAKSNWKFFLGDPGDAEALSFNDSAWRIVDVPHDWSIEEAPNEKNSTGSGGG